MRAMAIFVAWASMFGCTAVVGTTPRVVGDAGDKGDATSDARAADAADAAGCPSLRACLLSQSQCRVDCGDARWRCDDECPKGAKGSTCSEDCNAAAKACEDSCSAACASCASALGCAPSGCQSE